MGLLLAFPFDPQNGNTSLDEKAKEALSFGPDCCPRLPERKYAQLQSFESNHPSDRTKGLNISKLAVEASTSKIQRDILR